jgi:hypothetical protein
MVHGVHRSVSNEMTFPILKIGPRQLEFKPAVLNIPGQLS